MKSVDERIDIRFRNVGISSRSQSFLPMNLICIAGIENARYTSSPLLGNIYLHEVLDQWFELDVKPRMRGQCFLIRFVYDCVPRARRAEGSKRAQLLN